MDGGTGERWDEDPGWRLNWRVLIPVQLQMQTLRKKRGDALLVLRNIYFQFVLSMVLFGVVIPFVLPFRGHGQVGAWAIALVALGVATSLLSRVFERPVSCDSLADSFRIRMFVRVALAETAAVLGFAFAFTAPAGWLYYLGALLSIPGLVRAAPTREALVRDQQELTAQGCNRSLVAALRRPTAEPG
jgi:F0F1-type ATP synthase membrane subunit c/vacuolar-type H+-ATPase subunit K